MARLAVLQKNGTKVAGGLVGVGRMETWSGVERNMTYRGTSGPAVSVMLCSLLPRRRRAAPVGIPIREVRVVRYEQEVDELRREGRRRARPRWAAHHCQTKRTADTALRHSGHA